jgi:hypothetical protein
MTNVETQTKTTVMVDLEAKELRESRPTEFPTIEKARVEIWKRHPEWKKQYREECSRGEFLRSTQPEPKTASEPSPQSHRAKAMTEVQANRKRELLAKGYDNTSATLQAFHEAQSGALDEDVNWALTKKLRF